MNILQGVYFQQGRYADAEPIAKQALDVSRRVHGKDHPNTLDDVHNLATVYDRSNRLADAERLYREALDANRRVRGRGHPRTLLTALRLSTMYQRAKRFAEAEALLTAALSDADASGAGNSSGAKSLGSALASLYTVWGKPAIAPPRPSR